jgi:hypothetical protein
MGRRARTSCGTTPRGIHAPPHPPPWFSYSFVRTTSPHTSPFYKNHSADLRLEILLVSRPPPTGRSRPQRGQHPRVGLGRSTRSYLSPCDPCSRPPRRVPAPASPVHTPNADPPLPLPDDTAGILSGHLVFPHPRVPRVATQHTPPAVFPPRAVLALGPGHSPPRRLTSPSPTLAARTSTAPDDTLVPRRPTVQRTRASTPQPADLQWACRHRNCASIRPSPTRPDPGPALPTTQAPVVPSLVAAGSAVASCPTPACTISTSPP